MGIMENMQHIERYGGVSRGKCDGKPLENGECYSPVVLANFKRRKVSAVRDFPEGCGRNAPQIHARPSEVADSVGGIGVNSADRYTSEATVEAIQTSVISAEFQSPQPPQGSVHVGLECSNNLESNVEKPISSNMVEVLGLTNVEPGEIGLPASEATLEANCIQASIIGAESQSPQPLQGSVHIGVLECSNNLELNVKKPVVLSNTEEVLVLTNVEPGGTGLSATLGNAGSVDSLVPSKHEASEFPKNSQISVTTLPTEDIVLSSGSKSSSPPTLPIKDDNIMEKTVSWNYPPHKKISAIRDFPSLCGRNAPCLSKEECMKALDSMKTSFGQERSVIEEKLNGTVRTNLKELEDNVQDEGNLKRKSEVIVSRNLGDKVKVESQDDGIKERTKQIKSGSDANRSNHSSYTYNKKIDKKMGKEIIVYDENMGGLDRQMAKDIMVYDMEVRGVEGKVGNEIVLHNKNKSVQKNSSVISGSKTKFHAEDVGLHHEMDRMVVLGLMAEQNCPWTQQKGALKPDRAGKQGYIGKKHDFSEDGKSKSIFRTKKVRTENVGGQSLKRKISPMRKDDYHDMGNLVVYDEVDSIDDDEENEDSHVAHRSREFNVSLPPFGQSSSSGKGYDHDATVTRNKVRETLRIFQAVCRKLLQEEEAKPKHGGNGLRRVDLLASKYVKSKGKYVNTGKQILGSVPGVEVGDEFHYRVELAIVGLHRPLQAGIDYLKQGAKLIATSVVASGGYADDLDDSDVLIYMGSGGKITGGDKEPEDQKLERGNLALTNSAHAKSPVRVIRGFKETKASDSSDARAKVVTTYTYDGLYLVDKYWQEPGSHGKLVFQFQLVRIPGQPELAWNEVKKSKKLKIREGICVKDISLGKELIPICAINTINDEKPPQFKYITSMIYPNWCNPIPPRGCDCTYGCSESARCSCTVKNGLQIPYNHSGAIVEAKPLVYECGPSCKCPPSCHNRVGQHGIKFQLEIFKTVSRGWGVRSLNSIPSGSFICEYLGELLDDKEAEQRTGSDEYLFDIGQTYNDQNLCGGLSKPLHIGSCEVVEDGGFTIDAARYGNVGRFINHSCSPNLYAQNVLYDHEDGRMPHIMLFAAENIPPLQELTYHYNYTIDQVRDSNGNIKKKSCYCGSPECVGRMY